MKISEILALIVGYTGLISLFIVESNSLRIKILIGMYVVGRIKGGSEHPLIYSLFGLMKPAYKISGFVKPGYEKVREQFENNFEIGMERGSQCCVYVKGEKVVDLVGSLHSEKNYDRTTLQALYSSTKCLTSIVVAMLVDRGLLRYEQKISEVWPEFSKHGKENITIEQVLRHESGLQELKQEVTEKHTQLDCIRQNVVGEIIEDSVPKQYKPDQSNRHYHSASRGLILNEIIRRVDPKKRTIGEIVQQEINLPLQTYFYIGTPEEQIKNVTELVYTMQQSPLWFFIQCCVPKFLGSKVDCNIIKGIFLYLFVIGFAMFSKLNFQCKDFKTAQLPSQNGTANASSMAKIAGLIACGGKMGNVQLFSQKTFEMFNSDPIKKIDNMYGDYSNFNKGGNNLYNGDSQMGTSWDKYGFLGWQGMGGSVMNWNPEYQIGFGYAMNLCDADVSNMRGLKLRKIAYDCAQNLQKQQ